MQIIYGPVEGRRHDSSLLAESKLLQKLNVHSFAPDETPLCLYGGPAYPLRIHLMTGFKGAVTPQQHAFNEKMNSVRVTVEWIFGDIVRFFAFMDFKKDLKVNLSPIGKMYMVSALLQNAHTCLYGNTTSCPASNDNKTVFLKPHIFEALLLLVINYFGVLGKKVMFSCHLK